MARISLKFGVGENETHFFKIVADFSCAKTLPSGISTLSFSVPGLPGSSGETDAKRFAESYISWLAGDRRWYRRRSRRLCNIALCRAMGHRPRPSWQQYGQIVSACGLEFPLPLSQGAVRSASRGGVR
ncbi:hypothetical protein GMO_10450 [Gluconobacter morbifer G707]|uniref:Uncharacterized protein n=1 Tax=Gluconobacter morbifer G707 TaxID=1088869 RepID=G6XIU9_9PROT|nr:hypothetical protein GMO_10450 [Gluconobacter morbifer G707]